MPAYGRAAPWIASYAAEADALVPRTDPAAGMALLDGMGLVDRDGDGVREDADGNALSFTMVTNSWNQYRTDLVRLLSDEFRGFGIEIAHDPAEWGTVLGSIFGGTYEALLLGFEGADSMGESWNVWASDGDVHLWDIGQGAPQREWEERLDALHAEWNRTVDRDRLLQIERAVQVILAQELPLLSITRDYDYILMRAPYRNLRLVGPTRNLLPLARVFLE